MTDLPEPLVPADTDVGNLDGFLLDTAKLLQSKLLALSTGEEFKAAIVLWCRAWKEVPAGSLPDDDRILAALSGARSEWPQVRAMALRGFIKCSDGRLYHTTLCEDALRASEKQKQFSERTKAATEARKQKRHNGRNDERHDQRDVQRNVIRELPRNVVPPTPPITIESGGVGTRERVREVSDKVLSLIPRGHDTPGLVGGSWAVVEVWLQNGADPERDIYPTVEYLLRSESSPSSLKYFSKAIARATKTRQDARGDFENATSDTHRTRPGSPQPRRKTMEEALAELGIPSATDRSKQDAAAS